MLTELTTADNGQLINSTIGSANLDISAITAALASQYTEQQIRHAVLTFFLKTSEFLKLVNCARNKSSDLYL